jgi:uncharacterized protein YecE (DUF72 family)
MLIGQGITPAAEFTLRRKFCKKACERGVRIRRGALRDFHLLPNGDTRFSTSNITAVGRLSCTCSLEPQTRPCAANLSREDIMKFHIGTSGYSYKEWKGSFYPEKLPAKEMLGFYAQHFSTVEMNNTFYRMPTVEAVEAWAAQVPASFRLVLKAPQTITHRKRLKNVESDVAAFVEAAQALKKRLGPLLFQLPPNMKKDLPRLEEFLKLLPTSSKSGVCAAMEFRHESWLDEETYDCLRRYKIALCTADAEDLPKAELIDTAGWGYVRLRREDYTKAKLATWVKRMQAVGWREIYVLFRHEDTGAGPAFAKLLQDVSDAA